MANERPSPPPDPQLALMLNGEVLPSGLARANHKENGFVEYNERPVRIFELCLVVFVAFGISIWSSIYPLFKDAKNYEEPHTTFLYSFITLQIVAVLALLSYVLSRRGWLVSNPTLTGTPRGGLLALPLRLARNLICSVRQVRIFEWGLVLLFVFGNPVLNLAFSWLAAADYARGLSGVLAVNFYQTPRMLDHAIALSVLGYVLYRREGSFSDIGLRWSVGGAASALPLFLIGSLLSTITIPMFSWLGQTFGQPDWHPPDVIAMFYWSGEIPITEVPAELLNGFCEELIVRAFVMTEVTKLTQKPWLAVVVSVSIQTSYHFYQGVPLALSHILMFTVFSLFYAKTRSILPVALAHSLVDLDSVWYYGLRSMLQ